MGTGQTETAVLGGGCFWCIEAAMKDLGGVLSVKSGYAGGHAANPRYKEVCGGNTGHAEVVQVSFDPTQISYADLLRVFFAIHDPTTQDRQGADIGTQYRSVILANSPEQRRTAEDVRAEIQAAGLYPNKVVTQIADLQTFWPAEDEHDDYFARNPYSGYCQAVVAPKLAKFRKQFSGRLKKDAA